MRILIFSPFASIWRHSILESQLIDAISKSPEIETYWVGCGGLFPSDCTAREYLRGGAINTDERSAANCTKCLDSREILVQHSSARTLELLDFVNPEEVVCVEKFVSELKNDNLLEVVYQGIEVGKMALYEIMLKHKKRNLELTEPQFDEWKTIVRNECLIVFPSTEILKSVIPDTVVTYNAQYGIPGTFAEVAIMAGIKTYTMTGSSSPAEVATALQIWDWEKYKTEGPAKYEWPGLEDAPHIQRRDFSRLWRHEKYIETGKSPWTYSKGKSGQNPFEFFGINSADRIVLVVLNSEDEIFAAKTAGFFPYARTQSQVFSSQLEWVKYLIDMYSNRNGVQVIIRLHPREFPNKREKQLSEQALIWMKLLDSLPTNIHLDHPDSEFSLYDYFPYIQVLTTGWSSTAIEALSKGIPVVTYDQQLLGYPADILLTGNSREDYARNLEIAEFLLRDSKYTSAAHKWTFFSLFHGSVYLGGGLQDAHLRYDNPYFKFLLRGINRFSNTFFPGKIRLIDLRIPRSKSDDKKIISLFLNKKDNLYQI